MTHVDIGSVMVGCVAFWCVLLIITGFTDALKKAALYPLQVN